MSATFTPERSSHTLRSGQRYELPKRFLINVLSQRQRQILIGLVSLWFVTLVWFWQWWLKPQHIISIEGAVICSLLLAWNTMLPAYYFFFVWQMKRANPNLALARGNGRHQSSFGTLGRGGKNLAGNDVAKLSPR
jgi:hypothetical protein